MTQTYKISKGSWTGYVNFESLQEAQDWADNKGTGYTVELASADEQFVEEDIELLVDNKTEEDFKFGQYLLQLFVADNRRFEAANNTSITKQQTDDLIDAYEKLINYCSIGAINELVLELAGITPNVVFTQARKDKYQDLVDAYINS